MSIWNESRCEMISICLNCRETFAQTRHIKLRAGLDVGVAGKEMNLIFSYNFSNSFCKLLSLIPFTFKELNKASSCTYTKCNLWRVRDMNSFLQQDKRSWRRRREWYEPWRIIMKGDDLLSHRYLLFCTVVAPSFAIIALYKQSAFPEKEPEAVMKAIFPKGCSPNVMLFHLSLQMFLLQQFQNIWVRKHLTNTFVSQILNNSNLLGLQLRRRPYFGTELLQLAHFKLQVQWEEWVNWGHHRHTFFSLLASICCWILRCVRPSACSFLFSWSFFCSSVRCRSFSSSSANFAANFSFNSTCLDLTDTLWWFSFSLQNTPSKLLERNCCPRHHHHDYNPHFSAPHM